MNVQKNKILKLQQDNMRPQKIIENPDIIPDETYQMDEPEDNNSDERYQIGKIIKKTIIEDEETVHLKILSTAIETTNRKKNEELDIPKNEERD